MMDGSDDTEPGFVEIAIDERGIVCSWPAAAAELFGYERQRALGSSVGELLVPPRLRARHEDGLRLLQEGGGGLLLDTPVDVPVLHGDGRELRVSLTLRGGEHRFVGRIRELTERTPPDVELVLRASQDPDLEERHRLLTELSQLRTEFIRVASHELRTPLTSIITFAGMLEAGDDVVVLDPGDRQAALGVIRRNAERMQLLVADLLLLSQLETAETPLDVVRIDLVALLAFDNARTSIGPGPDPRGDEILLRQLFHTAVGVAALAHDTAHHTAAAAGAAAGGAASPVSVDASHADGRWTIRVYAENAATLTAERLLSMRIPHPDRPDEQRTGALALMLGREIAARHGGTMVTSVERPGVTVRITLPDY